MWVVGRPHSHSMMRDDPDHPSNRRDLAVELARWVDELAAFMDWSGLFLAPFAALEAWQHPKMPSFRPTFPSRSVLGRSSRSAAKPPDVRGTPTRLHMVVRRLGMSTVWN